MKRIDNRTKAILRFKTEIGSVNLVTGINELTQEKFDAMKAHPMFDSYKKTSQLILLADKDESDSEDGIDLNDIDLEKQKKEDLIVLANSLNIETENLTKKQLIEAINSKK